MEAESVALAVVEPDWNAIEERYLDGESSIELAEAFGTTPNAIRLRASKGKWKDKQLRRLQDNERELSKEVKGCLMVSVLREARMFRMQDPIANPVEADLWSKVRARLVDTASKLLGWERDALDSAKRVHTLDV